MKKTSLKCLSLILAFLMLVSAFASCSSPEEGQSETESNNVTESATQEQNSESETKAVETEIETETTVQGPLLEGEHATLIENADYLKNGVNAYFTHADRKEFTYENLKMQMEYALSADQKQQVTYLSDKKGNPYITDTMDVFVELQDGSRYYASNSTIAATGNIFRFGYYFYEMRFEEQIFVDELKITESADVDHLVNERVNNCKAKKKDGILTVVNSFSSTADPYVVFGTKFTYSADKYQFLEITMKADAKTASGAQLFITAGDKSSFTAEQSYNFSITTDDEYHTYRIPLTAISGYTGTLKALRIDVNGAGATYSISSIKLISSDMGNAPTDLSLCRSFNVYSDKMYQIIQIAAQKATSNIANVGILTEINADTVEKLIVKDKNGTHYTIENIDWASAEYVAFDIKNAGIFGYILPFDGKGGTLHVTKDADTYIIEQTLAPKNNTIIPSLTGTENANDFYMGQRIYTDSNHNFTEFLDEAYCERNPLGDKNIVVDEEYSTDASFVGYDSLNGIYVFKTTGPSGGFNTSYYSEPNKHYRISFNIIGDDHNRNIYIMTHTQCGSLECAALLDGNDVLLPVSLEVGKNFSEASGDRGIFNLDDATYGQVIFPMVIEANSKNNNYTILNLYQNWGNYPLKQISWIQFLAPYYHLSTGVTETNCILPWFHTRNTKSLNTLPDCRTMSAPFWTSQPQHNSCGTHNWLIYTDEDGRTITTENVLNVIDSYGPVYADVQMDAISDDGRIKVSYVHTEMPQLDENRIYYEMTYEFLEDITFEDFSRDFQFYSVTSNFPSGKYTRLGYLNENNESVVITANTDSTSYKEYTLGTACPYFSYFDIEDYSQSPQQGYGNLAFLVYNSEFVVGGKETDFNFAIVDKAGKISVTLALDEVTFKAGDTFTINAIVLPWGSQELEPVWATHLDKNVRDVRTNSLLNPLKATGVADCEVLESVFVPKVKTTNGTSAEFTISGGHDNCAVRVYGFEEMTVPVIYELIDGKWQEYAVNSSKNPDAQNNAHYYDGYSIHYDGDGTFSYSFIVEMDEGKARTFKVVADGNYEKWDKESTIIDPTDGFNNVIDPTSGYTASDLHFAGKIDAFCGNSSLAQNFNSADGLAFVNYNGKTIAGTDVTNYALQDGYYFVLSGWTMVEGGITKYVWSADNGKTWHDMEMFGRTLAVGSAAMISGATDRIHNTFTFSENDTKNVSYQGANAQAPKGIAANLQDYAGQTVNIIFAAVPVKDEKTLCPFIVAKNVTVMSADNEDNKEDETEADQNTNPVYNEYVKEGSGYSVSSLRYASCLDMLNGTGPTSGKYTGRGGNSLKGVDIFEYNGKTLSGGKLVFTGWSVVDGGVSKYVWSADGGKTWHDVVLHNKNSIDAATQAHLDGVRSRINETLNSSSAANAVYQGSVGLSDPSKCPGLAADLSSYAGQTVNVIFAAVSAKNPTTLCVLHYVKGVTIN